MKTKLYILGAALCMSVTSSSWAAEKSLATEVIESISSTSFSQVECSMEDYTCQKIIIEMGRQEALSRVLSGETGNLSEVLEKSIAIVRQNNVSARYMSDDEIIKILAKTK